MKFIEERARDDLVFDPLPDSCWISVDDKLGILVSVRYSEPLSRLLRLLPNSKWEAEYRRWRYPFSSGDAIRRAIPEIERLAALAHEKSEKETELREAQRASVTQIKNDERRARERQIAMAQPRPLQTQFLNVITGRPRFAISLEAIGDNMKALGPMVGFRSRNWVARIFGSDGRGGWARVFVSGAKDYCRSNSVGSRGIYVTYFLEEGPIYEVSSPQSWNSTERYFLRITNSQPQRLTKEEVEQCLVK
ncbi:MAG: hypothetical protein IPI58_09835 [Alphaproteobacteria bacterium]|nr:MAG: hypothetical protein IPI58_09835 [Alphaproteobacteria bacterium]